MRLLTTLPFFALSATVLAHAHNNTPQGRTPSRHPLNVRYDPSPANLVQRATTTADDDDDDNGLLGGLLGSKEPSTSTTSTVSIKPTTSAAPTTTSAVHTTTPAVVTPTSTPLPSTISSAVASVSLANSSLSTNGTSMLSSATMANLTSTLPSSTAISSAQPSSESIPLTTITTDDQGQATVITRYLTATPSSEAAQTSAAAKSSDGGISTGAIIGISVGVGVVVLTLIGCAIWRMKRRHGDEDEAIRWPELNRHGDSDVHHALPAKQTGKHGFATSPLERSLSNSSSIFAPSTVAPAHSAPAMTLNGSNFGASSSLEDYDYDEKAAAAAVPTLPEHGDYPGSPVYEHDEDYTNMPPQVQMHQTSSTGGVYGGYDSEAEDGSFQPHGQAGIGAATIAMPEPMGRSQPYYHGQ